MKLVVGLGNPGEKYQRTRHNIGFMVLDQFLEDTEPVRKTFWEEEKKCKGLIKRVTVGSSDVILLKPTTYMNLSGISVQLTASYYKIQTSDVYIVYDDVDLPLGTLKIRFGGGSGGHKGINSIAQTLNTDQFLRIRLGIGRPTKKIQSVRLGSERIGSSRRTKFKNQKSVEDYVLSDFSRGEMGKVRHVVKEAIRNTLLLLQNGIELYMSKYHKKI